MDTHNDRETVDSFLRWLTSKVSGLPNQIPINKNQLQELLLGIALFLRDLEMSCFMDPSETTIPPYIADGCLQPSDAGTIGDIVNILYKVVRNQLE